MPLIFAKSIKYALDNGLQRMQTDYLDLYQLHWPERTNTFGRAFTLQDDEWEDNIHEVLNHSGWFCQGREKSNTSDYLMKMLGELCDFRRK
jgi:aryl-alcohol dehydrogenase-like predicted oxidoreductase